MQVRISHQEGMTFKAKTEKSEFIIDCPTISPVEYFLSGIICCSATDMVLLPKNQGYEVSDLEVNGEVVRNEDHPRKFNTLHLGYTFTSSADEDTAAKWVMASVETYCSTINTIRDSVKISYSITYNGKKIRDHVEMISGGGSAIDLGEIDACGA